MMAEILCVRNMTEGTDFDVWTINTEEEYAEEGEADEGAEMRLVAEPRPQRSTG